MLSILFLFMVQAAGAVTLSVQDGGSLWPASMVGNYVENGTLNGVPRYDGPGWYIYRVNIWGANNWVVSNTLGSADYNNSTIAFYVDSDATTPPLGTGWYNTNSGSGTIIIASGGTATPPAAPTIYSLDPDGNGMPPYITSAGNTIVYWSAVTGAVGYKLDVATNSTFTAFVPGYNGLVVTGSPIPTYRSVSGLTSPGTTYYFRVRSYNGVGDSGNSGTLMSTTIPSAPTATAASGIYGHEFQANWNAQTGASYYKLYVCTDAGFSACLSGYNPSSEYGTSSSLTGLTPATTHYYRLRASNENGDSGLSNTISLITNSLPVLGGTFTTAGAVNDNSTIAPFSGVTVSDPNGDNVSVTITYDWANGTLTGTGLSGSAGSYVLGPATQAAATANLQALVFHPTLHQAAPGSTVVTTFSLTPNDGKDDGATNSSTVVTTTMTNLGPTFVGATNTLTVSQDASATDIRGLLHVSDSDSGQTETWTQSAAPNHGGTLNFVGATAASGSTDITPGGTITYAPVPGYSGTETFTIQVSDSMATATRTITVTVVPPPTVTGITPAAGPLAGGTAVTITGTNFTGATSVTIGGAAATGVVVVNGTTITAVTPAGTAGAQNVAVTTPGGTGTGTGLFTYMAPPTVTGIAPAAGPLAGGTAVTITGTNFTGATSVTIGGAAATGVVVVNATTITAVTPAGTAGAQNVAVTTPGGTGTGTGLFTYMAPPTVTGIAPAAGPLAGGTAVTITGTNFTGATSVTIGGAAATGVVVVNVTTIAAVTPGGTAGAQNVAVTTPGGTGTGTGLFTYVMAPTVTSIIPNSGPTAGGTSITITGTNFLGATAVNFGSTAASSYSVISNTTISAASPAQAAGAVQITVTTVGGVSLDLVTFTYVPAPTVTGVSPSSGPTAGGTTVTITGTNFTGATAVAFGGTPAGSYTVDSATQITATTAAHAAGAAQITVTTVGGTSSDLANFTFVAPPIVNSVSVPANGTYVAGQNLDFTVNFSEAVTVDTAGGTPYIPITLNIGGTVQAAYISGSGSSVLTFRYTVVSGNADPDGITLGGSITANGATLRDAVNNDAVLTLNSVGSSVGVLVDAIAPTISISTPSAANTISGPVDYTITYTGADTVTLGSANITLNPTGTATGTVSVSGSGTASRTVTISGISGSGTLGISIAAGTASDNAGNTAPAAGPSVTFIVCTNSSITVSNNNDSGPGTLRQAIADICPGGTIGFSVTGTIGLTSGELVVDKDMTISGPGANALVISGLDASRVFNVKAGTTATIQGITVSNGSVMGPAEYGGGVYNYGTLTVTNSTIAGNTSDVDGGGVFNWGTMTVTNCTISGNSAFGDHVAYGGGIRNAGIMTVTNSTISGNRAGGYGGGIYNDGTMVMTNSTISGNSIFAGGDNGGGIYNSGTMTTTNVIIAANIATAGANCWVGAVITDGGNNIEDGTTCGFSDPTSMSNTDPMLDPAGLKDNGGPTKTVALVAGSPAINAATGCPATDQRGITRPQGANCDIGAYEFVTGTTVTLGSSQNPSVFGQSVTFTAAVTGVESGTPTGTATFFDGAIAVCSSLTLDGSGRATCSTSTLPVGARSITAVYSGDTDYAGSTSTVLTQTVNQASTTTAIISDTPDPSAVGQAVTVSYIVGFISGSGVVSPGVTPTGNVTVSDGVDSCTATAAAGSCSLALTTAGARTLTATYAGDTNFNGSIGTAPHDVLLQHLLSVSVTGSGTVTGNITGVEGNGLHCGSDCSETFNQGTAVTLTATPAIGWKLSGWSGDPDCSDGQVTLNSPLNCMATFVLNNSVVIPAATGNGNIALTTNSPGCGFITWGAKTEAQVGADTSYEYPYGLVEFTLNCAVADVTITFPGNIGGTTYRKYGPTTPGNALTKAWYTFSNVTANSSTSITLHLTDGELGDDTGKDGIIVDQGGPGQQSLAVAVPTMNEWGMLLFVLFAGVGSLYYLRRRRMPRV